MKKIKNVLKNYIKTIKDLELFQKIIFFAVLFGFLILFVLYTKITLILSALLLIIVLIWGSINNSKFNKRTNGNGVIAGGRGKGKGLLLNKKINLDKNDYHFCNVPYNDKTKVINIKEYIDSIAPNTTQHFINNSVIQVPKLTKYEKRNIYWDDVGTYAPNFMDNELKKYYPSLSALLPINRHLYDAFMIITVQDFQRPYKLLRELQTDFAIKALKTYGTFSDKILNSLPIIRHFLITKYIYYENVKSAFEGKLPFNAKGVVNETIKHGVLTAGQATKEEYQAINGIISYGYVIQRKKMVNYDTRYFHKLVFGKEAPKN